MDKRREQIGTMYYRLKQVHTMYKLPEQRPDAEPSPTILLIDRNLSTQQPLEAVLISHGFRVVVVAEAKIGLQKLQSMKFDLVLLDTDLADQTDMQTYRQFVESAESPVIVLSSKALEDEIVAGLDAGAVDYVTKPFSAKILVARIRAILRLSKNGTHIDPVHMRSYRDTYLSINLADRQLQVQGEKVKLTPTELRLLAHLVKNAGRVCTYGELLENVWGWEYRDSMDYLYTYIRRLRLKIEPDVDNPQYILGEHSVGYWFRPTNKDA